MDLGEIFIASAGIVYLGWMFESKPVEWLGILGMAATGLVVILKAAGWA